MKDQRDAQLKAEAEQKDLQTKIANRPKVSRLKAVAKATKSAIRGACSALCV